VRLPGYRDPRLVLRLPGGVGRGPSIENVAPRENARRRSPTGSRGSLDRSR
jgi:hypothetical protein